MTVAGTVYVWDGTTWVLTVASGSGGGDPPPPDELLATFTFPGGDITGWASGGTWTQDPTDYAAAVGGSGGETRIKRIMPTGTTYVEVDCYNHDDSSDNWMAIRLFDTDSSFIYDSVSYGVLIRGNGEILQAWSGGSETFGDDLVGAEKPGPTAAEAKTIGFEVVGTTGNVYVDGVLHHTQTGQTDRSANPDMSFGAYNGSSIHIHEIRCYSAKPA